MANTLSANSGNEDDYIMAFLIIYYTSESSVVYFPQEIEPGEPWRKYSLNVCVKDDEPMTGSATQLLDL